MRRLVACPKCNRGYDASALAVGRRFHCHCGAVLTVQQARGHDADVVCCASCGAPREKGGLSCDHCGADFTLHERDLHTVCPHCLTRVSDRARFCHYCGKAILAEMVAGEPTELCCPACGDERHLASRAWSDVSVMECDRCAGLWLSNQSFQHVTTSAAADGGNVDRRARPGKARQGTTDVPEAGYRYRRCAVCRELMPRLNYARRSGVVIDLCKYHGAWFDADELPRILDWIRAGGLARANEEIAAKKQQEEEWRAREGAAVRASMYDPHDDSAPLVVTVLGELGRWFFTR